MYPSLMAASDYPHLPDNQTSYHNVYNFRSQLALHLRPYGVSAGVILDTDAPPKSHRKLSKGYLWPRISGYCYWPTKAHPTARIKLNLHHLPGEKRFAITTTRKQQLRFRIMVVLGHELIHRHQMDTRLRVIGKSSRVFGVSNPIDHQHAKDQKYLGDYDEIEAYAHDTFQEMWYYGQVDGGCTTRKFMKRVREIFHDQDMKAPVIFPLCLYKDTFGGDSSHPAVQTLFRKIREWEKVGIPIDVS
jgi:hypothetical protein